MNTLPRPTSITVMGILNLVFGGMSLIGLVCIGSLVIVGLYFISIAPVAPGEDDPKEMLKTMDAAAPSFKYYGLALTVATLVESVLLVTSGWGLLRMRPWGRTLALTYAFVCILGGVGGLVYTFAHLNPTIKQWEEAKMAAAKEAAKDGAEVQPPNLAFATGSGSEVLDNAFTVVSTLFMMALAVANLIVMMMPSVKKAFADARAVVPGRTPEDAAPG
jgi:hypothetical protein